MQRPASSASASKTFATIVLVIGALVASSAGQANIQGQWSTLSTPMPINPVHVALLNNGKVLVVAGSGNCPPSQSGCPSGAPYGPSNGSGALLVDPVSGQIISQFSISWDMFCNGMVVLPDGRPFINGGTLQYDPFHGELKSSVFDPATNTFTNVQNMAHGRWYPTVTTLGDGRVMTFSGLDENGNTNTSVEIYSVSSGWSSPFSASWTPPLFPRMHVLPSGKVFYSGATTTSRIFDPSAHTWTNVATTNYSSTRTYGTSVLLPLTPANNYDPHVIIMGGGNPATATTELIDLGSATPTWSWGPNMSEPRIEMSATILPDGKILATGGSLNDEDTTTASLNADLYDPATNTFSSAGANSYARLYHSVSLLLPDGTVWLAGSNPQRGTYEQNMEIYQPAYLFTTDSTGNVIFATRPSISSSPTGASYGSSFTVQTPDAANISSVALIRNGAATHAFDMDQRFVGLSFTVGSGALTVTAPPNGNIAPPGYYMLFLVNSSGVPSIAKFVQLGSQPDFSVSATPSSQNVTQGNSTSYTVNVASSGGFAGTVGLSVSGLPQGATAVFNPTSITTSGSSTLIVSTLNSTPAGSYPLTITATSGSLTHTATVTLVVNGAGSFSVSAVPTNQTVSRGSSTQFAVTISAQGGFSGTVNLSVSGLPTRTSSSFNPTSVVGSGTSTLTIKVNRNARVGTYTLTINGTSGSLVQSATVTLTIQ
jgi:Domain of unknown function (DUF1929)